MRDIDNLTNLKNFLEVNNTYIDLILTTLAILLVANIIKRILTRLLLIKKDNKTEYQQKKLINFLITTFTILLLIVIWMPYIKNILTFISFISAAMTIALREFIYNLFSGIYIRVRKPFSVEDRIEIDETRGDVININMLNFEILEVSEKDHYNGQSTGIIVTIPNSMIFTKPLKNFNKIFKYIWNEMTIKIPLEENVSEAKRVIYKIVNNNEIVNKIPTKMQKQIDNLSPNYRIYYNKYEPIIYTKVDGDVIELTVRYLIHPKKVRYVESTIWEQILKANSNGEIKLYKS